MAATQGLLTSITLIMKITMTTRLSSLLLCSVFLISCSPSKQALMDQKFDTPLRLKVDALMRAGESEELLVFGKCDSPLDEKMKGRLEKCGARVQTVTGDIFTARIPSEKIFRVAKLKFVAQLQLSQESKPLSP